MQILFNSPKIKKQVDKIKTYAMNNIMDFTGGIPDDHKPCGDNPQHVLSSGIFKIVYSIEKQKITHAKKKSYSKIELFHHISISTLAKKLPHPEMVEEILHMFDMSKLNDHSRIKELWIEDETALNILEVKES